MRRFFGRRPKAATTGSAAQQSQPKRPPAAASSSTKTFPSGIKPLCCPAGAIVDIIFVHGLTGDREKTWTASDASEPWPQALLPSELPTARVLTFGYDAYVTDWRGMVSQDRIANHAWNLLTSLASYRDKDGTVGASGRVHWALFTSRQRPEPHLHNVLQLTRGIAFLGTPHHGSGLARWAELLSRSIGVIKQTNTQIVEVLKRDSEVLARIQDGFHTMVKARSREGLPPIEISCFYEELPLQGVGLVVPQDSAILPGYIPIGIHSNHSDMTKFTSTDDPGFVAVSGELRRWIRDIEAAESRRENLPLSNNRVLDEQPGTATQHGDGNRQFNNFGTGTQKNVDGNYFEAKGNQNFGSRSKACRVIPFPRNEDVVDRTHIFRQLNALLPPASEYQSAALWGLGGSGKTQVALEYAYCRSRDPACSVFWVHADNETTFTQDYKVIAKRLGLADSLDGPELLTAVREQIEADPCWLVILDNADNLAAFGVVPTRSGRDQGRGAEEKHSLYDFVPRGPAGTVLWTSRDQRIGGSLVGARRAINVASMTEGEARMLLETAIGREIAEEESHKAIALLAELERLPLAVSQAAAYMKRTATPIGEYLSRLQRRTKRWEVLSETEFDRHRRRFVPNNVMQTWNISIEHVRQENRIACDILHSLAFVDNQNIPFELVAKAAEIMGRLSRNEEAAGAKSAGSRGQDQDEDRGDNDDARAAIVLLQDFSFLRMRTSGKGHQAYEMHKLVQEATHAYEYRRKVLGERHPDTIRSMAELAVTYYAQGRYEEAEKIKVEVLALRRDVLGEKHPNTIGSMASLAATYHAQGRYEEAEKINVEVLALRRDVLGEKHPDTIGSMAELAATYYTQGRYEEAEKIVVEVLALWRDVLGEKHPDTIGSIASLAATYHAQGRYKEAEKIKVEVLALLHDVLGEKHPDTIGSMAELAATYHAQGYKVEKIKVEVLALLRDVLGEKHPDTIGSMAELAATYHAQGRYEEAEKIKVEVLALRRDVLGEKHPDTIGSMASLAATYHAQGRYKEVEKIKVEVLALQRDVLGEKHPDTIRSMALLAATYHAQGRYEEAEKIKVEVLALRRDVLGEKHPDTIGSMAELAVTYYAQGRYEEAEKIKVEVLALRRDVLGEKHPDTIGSMAELAATYYAQGRYKEAEKIVVEVLALQRDILREKHPNTIGSMALLAATYHNQGRYEEAEKIKVEVLALRRDVLGEKHPDTIGSMASLAAMYYAQGEA
ncbi:hypothetical protein N0V88_007757 [Collariella sp. IMI 366227]|nr:hypothetical protein N0V88_007757 [Collariella sp. IMI 366227]